MKPDGNIKELINGVFVLSGVMAMRSKLKLQITTEEVSMAKQHIAPVHPGLFLKELLEELNLSQYRLVRELAIPAMRYILPEFGIGSRACARKKNNKSLRKKNLLLREKVSITKLQLLNRRCSMNEVEVGPFIGAGWVHNSSGVTEGEA
jgi:hypothetical protein